MLVAKPLFPVVLHVLFHHFPSRHTSSCRICISVPKRKRPPPANALGTQRTCPNTITPLSTSVRAEHEELKLRESMGYDAKKMAELWSAPPPLKELELKLTHYQNDDQQLTLTVVNNLLVRQLKERIVEEVGRGTPSKIMLSVSGENALNDDVALSSLENEIQGGLLVMGIDMSKGKEVRIKLVHAASDTPQSLTLTVLDTVTMLELRRQIMERLGETSLSKCKLVRRVAAGGFQGLGDDERLNKKRELLFGNPEEDPPVTSKAEEAPKKVSEGTKPKAKPKAEQTAPKKEVSQLKAAEEVKPKVQSAKELSVAQPREMHVKITHLLEADQEMSLGVSSDFLVRELKDFSIARMKSDGTDPVKARASLGPLFASACMAPLRNRQLPVSKKGFEDFFAVVWQNRSDPKIVALTSRIEGLLGVPAGQWFGFAS
ncbi:unnamed protein product [Durusdinium trenchii]|uniref:Ubiquitin-like domain-containing protein n=1 Tax=Durusdinium trenchii TaxID=1381693 RepID=A0ABP0T2U8_9DINO